MSKQQVRDIHAYLAELDDIPGTRVFTAARARKGYWLNQFAMSLMKSENREAWKADERKYLEDWPMTEDQKEAILARDYNRCLDLGGNVYFLAKVFSPPWFCDGGNCLGDCAGTGWFVDIGRARCTMGFANGTAPLGLRGWQFAFLVASIPGFVLALLMWRLREPERGGMDGIVTPTDPHPFKASFSVLAAVTPGFNWLNLYRRGADRRMWAFNLGTLLCIVIVMTGLVLLTSAVSPRPYLTIGSVSINPHLLQWTIIGFGIFVIVSLMQNMRLTDPEAFRVISRSPTLIMVIAVGTLQSVINYGMMSFNPMFLMNSYKLSMADTALQFGLLSAAMGILGPLFWGPFSDWLQKRYPGAGRAYVALFTMGLSPVISFWVYTAPSAPDFYFRFVIYSVVLTGWMPPLYAIMFDQVLPRMRGITASVYLLVMTILGLGIGPYIVGLISDATGNLKISMLSVNAVGIPIIILLLIIARRAQRDENDLLKRANDTSAIA